MNMHVENPLATATEFDRVPLATKTVTGAVWVTVFIVLVASLAALLIGIVGPAPPPERLLEALLFVGALAIAAAALCSRM